MQLATTQRPQPPPVPPRPSRQVVAEAIKKRSPRPPPCPTRQAPPPPNTRPWQSPEQEGANSSKSGRTIVYESARSAAERETRDQRADKNEGNVTKTRNEASSNRVPSERSAACVSASRVQRLAPNQTERAHDRENLAESGAKAHDPKYVRATNGIVQHATPRDFHFPRVRDSLGCTSERERNVEYAESDTSSASTRRDRPNGPRPAIPAGPVVGASDKEFSFTVTTNPRLKDTRSRSLRVEGNNEAERKGATTRSARQPTSFPKSETRAESAIEKTDARESSGQRGNSTANPTISSGDGPTVVVVDEPERKVAFEDNDNIQRQDWLEAGVRYSSTKITLPGDDSSDRVNDCAHLDDLDFSSVKERIAMSTLQGLPPLPRSLSGFNLNETRDGGEAPPPPPPPPPARSSSKSQRSTTSSQLGTKPSPPPGRQLTTLDTQLSILRREMFSLRQLDLSLLSQLWSLNESIQEFRQLLQDQEDCFSPSSSSEEGDDTSYDAHPPPPPRRSVPAAHQHRHHHLRPSRSPGKPSASDDSPSSEEYGAV